jgi:hypothetical protein
MRSFGGGGGVPGGVPEPLQADDARRFRESIRAVCNRDMFGSNWIENLLLDGGLNRQRTLPNSAFFEEDLGRSPERHEQCHAIGKGAS